MERSETWPLLFSQEIHPLIWRLYKTEVMYMDDKKKLYLYIGIAFASVLAFALSGPLGLIVLGVSMLATSRSEK